MFIGFLDDILGRKLVNPKSKYNLILMEFDVQRKQNVANLNN